MIVNDVIHSAELQKKCGDWPVYEYPRRAVTADVVCFYLPSYSRGPCSFESARVLLVQRKNDPHKGKWCLPGGFVEINETVEEGAKRELFEETGVCAESLYLSGVYSNPKRDVRGIISIGFFTLFLHKPNVIPCLTEVTNTRWQIVGRNCYNIRQLGFDHDKIVRDSFYELEELSFE